MDDIDARWAVISATSYKKAERFNRRYENMIAIENLTSVERDLHGQWRRLNYIYCRYPDAYLGFYVAPDDKYSGDTRLHSKISECLILPHTLDELHRRFSLHLGLMFTFLTDREETVQILDLTDTAVTTIHFTMVVRRFNYRLKGNGIIIDRVRDPIMHPESFKLTCPTIRAELDLANAYYTAMIGQALHLAVFDDI